MAGLRRAALPLLLSLAACGYRVATPYRARGGIERLHVGAFENDSTDPELGAALTGALRDELARRGAGAEAGASAELTGTIRTTAGVASSFSSSASTVGVEIHARLSQAGKLVHEVTVHRAEAHQGGADPLESEGRRATALRKVAREAARDVLAALEAPGG